MGQITVFRFFNKIKDQIDSCTRLKALQMYSGDPREQLLPQEEGKEAKGQSVPHGVAGSKPSTQELNSLTAQRTTRITTETVGALDTAETGNTARDDEEDMAYLTKEFTLGSSFVKESRRQSARRAEASAQRDLGVAATTKQLTKAKTQREKVHAEPPSAPAVAKTEEGTRKAQQPPGTGVIDELLKYDQETYQIKRPFLRAQYHQCVPNPQAEGELISVQICSLWDLGFAEPGLSVSEMDRPSHLIAPYTSEKIHDRDHRKLQTRIALSEEKADTREADNQHSIGKANDAEPLEFSGPLSTGAFKTEEHQHAGALKRKNQVAIIGSWRKDEFERYYCYSYSYVPNPCVREYARSERNSYIHGDDLDVTTLSVYEVLFKGQGNELFMMFNPGEIVDKTLRPEPDKWRLGILNLSADRDWGDNRPFPAQHYQDKKTFTHEFPLDYPSVVKKIECDKRPYKARGNPVIFKRPSSAASINAEADAEQVVLVVPDAKELLLIELGQKEPIKKLTDGDLFIKYEEQDDTIYYLEGLPTKKKQNVCSLVALRLNGDQAQKAHEDEQTVTILTDDPSQGTQKNKKLQEKKTIVPVKKTHLDCEGLDVDFSDDKKGTIIEAYMHNEDRRVTIVKHGCLSLTFERTHEDSMELKFHIDSQVCKGIHVGADLYIEGELRSLEKSEKLAQQDTIQMQLSFYNVSEPDEANRPPQKGKKADAGLLRRSTLGSSSRAAKQTTKVYRPKSRETVVFPVSALLFRTLFSDGKFFSSLMPMTASKWQPAVKDGQAQPERFFLTGSAVFEDQESGEVQLSIFRSSDKPGRQYHPQHALRQSFVVDYPILAYKSISPDNKEIVLVHLAHDMPQRSIHLNSWEFVSFVKGNFEVEDTRKQIILLVRNRQLGQTKLIMIFIDPWKDIDFSQPFDLPENIFAVRNSKISMPRSKEALGMYSSDKIRSVCILPQEGYRDRMATLIVQFWHSIWSISGGSTRRLTDPGKMVPEYVIQGCQNRIFLAEENLDRSEIHMLCLSKKHAKVLKHKVFSLECQLVGMETDTSNEKTQQDRSTIFALGSDQRLLHLQESKKSGELFECIGVYDYTGYDMRAIIENPWSRCHIAPGAVTFDEYVYEPNSSDNKQPRGQGCFYWPEAKHISEDARVYDLDTNRGRIAFERVKVQQLTDTTSMIAIGREPKRKIFYECGTWFLIRPAHGSREFSLYAEERRARDHKVSLMAFATNSHLLTQFRKIPQTDEKGRIDQSESQKLPSAARKTIIFGMNGEIKPQMPKIQEALDQNIVGESELLDGTKYFITSKTVKKTRSLALLKSHKTGRISLELKIADFQSMIRDNLDDFLHSNDLFKDQQKLACAVADIRAQELALVDQRAEALAKATPYLRRKALEKWQAAKDKLVKFKASLADDVERLQSIKEDLRFSSKFLVSNKRTIVALAKLELPEDVVAAQRDKTDYSVHLHTIKLPELGRWQVKLIVVQSSAKDMLETFQTRLAGQYFCYRQYDEKQINFMSLNEDDSCERGSWLQLKNREKVGLKRSKTGHSIDLSHILASDKRLIKYVTFDGLKKDSALRHSEMESHARLQRVEDQRQADRLLKEGNRSITQAAQGLSEYNPRHWLNVSVANTSYVFDLDPRPNAEEHAEKQGDKQATKAKDRAIQIDLLESTDQLHNLDSFINTGTGLASVVNDTERVKSDEQKDWPLLQRIITNEPVSIYFMRRNKATQIRGPSTEEGIAEKHQVKEFEGNYYRTYSFLDLLNLIQARNLVRRGEEFSVGDQTLLSVYEGHTFFSIFQFNPQVFEQIHRQLRARQFADSVDSFKNPTEDVFLRRLYRILCTPTNDHCLGDPRCREEKNNWCAECEGAPRDSDIWDGVLEKWEEELIEEKKEEIKEEQKQKIIDEKIKRRAECRCQGFQPLIMKSIHFRSTKCRDQLLQILMFCGEFEVTSLVIDIEDMNELFTKFSSVLGKAFHEKCFTTNRSCTDIEQLQGNVEDPNDWKTAVVLGQTSTLDQEALEHSLEDQKHGIIGKWWKKRIGREQHSTTVQVEINMIRTGWLFKSQGSSAKGNDFLKFIDHLDQVQNETLYTTTFVAALLMPVHKLREHVILWVFFPFVIQSICCVVYFSLALQEEEPTFSVWCILAEAVIIGLSAFFLWLEHIQFKEREGQGSLCQRLRQHFAELTNICEFSAATLNIFLVVNEWSGRSLTGNHDWLKFFAVCDIGLVWYKAFYWMRLFSKPAFFMNLLTKTLKGITSFTLMLAILIGMLSNVIYLANQLEHAHSEGGESQPDIYSGHFGNAAVNAVLHMYLLSLGEFDFDGFANKGFFTQCLLWTLFVFGTFMLQITFMNMLIAIMAQVFEAVTEEQQQSSLSERILLLNDFRVFLDFFELGLDAQFLFVVSPSQQSHDDDSLESQVASIKEQMQNQTSNLLERQARTAETSSSKLKSITDDMHEMNEDIDSRINGMGSNIEEKINAMTKSILAEISALKTQRTVSFRDQRDQDSLETESLQDQSFVEDSPDVKAKKDKVRKQPSERSALERKPRSAQEFDK